MKLNRYFFTAAILLLIGYAASAQCPGCVIDPACATAVPDGGLCPAIIPSATVGEPYDFDVTFYIPQNLTDPGTGINVDVQQVTIVGVDGLPFGLAWECSNAATGCVYNPPASPPASELGCVKICGTPLDATGTYTVDVEVIAEVVAFGITLTQPQTYSVSFDLVPGTGTDPVTFDFSGAPDCNDNYLVDFAASINAAPFPTTYAWDFGNGNTSADQNPPTQTYATPASYEATLTTTTYDYVLNTVNLNSMNDNWCGDVEEPSFFGTCTGNPDPYFELRDAGGNLLYTSNTIDGVLSASWTGLGITLTSTPISIKFLDEDPVSVDDDLGTFSFNLTATGTASFAGAGGTSGTIDLGQTPNTVYNDTGTINAFANTIVGPFFNVSDATTIGGTDGAVDMTFSGGTPPYFIFWSNGSMDEDISGLAAGDYTVLIIDDNGCQVTDTVTVGEPANVPCDPAPASLLAIPLSPSSVLLSWGSIGQPVDAYQLRGRKGTSGPFARRTVTTTSFFVDNLTPGDTYQWKVRAKCLVTGNVSGFSSTESFTLPTARDAGEVIGLSANLYPNPASGTANLEIGIGKADELLVEMTDGLGKLVKSTSVNVGAGMTNVDLSLSEISAGIYFVTVSSVHGKVVKKLIVE